VPLIFEMGQAALLALAAGKVEQGMVWTPILCQSGRHVHIHTLTCTTAHPHYLTEIAVVLTYQLSGKRASHNYTNEGVGSKPGTQQHTARHGCHSIMQQPTQQKATTLFTVQNTSPHLFS